MHRRSRILIAASLLLLPWSTAFASELGTAPHFLTLGDRERIVLFSDGPIAGALADQRADGSIVVTVPKVAAGATIAGREFDDTASGGSGRTKVRVTSTPQGDARIEISGAGAVERVHAYGTTKPARLTIDLLHRGASEKPPEVVKAAAKPAAPTAGATTPEAVASKTSSAPAAQASAPPPSLARAESTGSPSAAVARPATATATAVTTAADGHPAVPKPQPAAVGADSASAAVAAKGAKAQQAAQSNAPVVSTAAAKEVTVAAAAAKESTVVGAAVNEASVPAAATTETSVTAAAAKGASVAAAAMKDPPVTAAAATGASVAAVAAKEASAPAAVRDTTVAVAAAQAAPVAGSSHGTSGVATRAHDVPQAATSSTLVAQASPGGASHAAAEVVESVKDLAPAAPDDTRDLPVAAPGAGQNARLLAQAAPAQAPAPTPTASPAVTAKDKSKKKGKGSASEVASSATPPLPGPGAASATTAIGGAAAATAGRPAASAAPVVAAAAPAAPAAPAPETLVCRWRRVAGVPYCGPDPKDGIYAADLGTAEIAGLLDRSRSGPTLVRLPDHGPAEAHLNADVALIHAAKSGYLLPVLVEYEQALRTYPNFPDAKRSRANVALIYHTLGFAPELERLARAKNDPVAPFAAVLLADLWRDREEHHDLAPLLATGRSAGGITNCLAERVAANLAADEAKAAAFPGAFADLSKVCPRTILEDSETAWLRGRAMLLGGEAKRAAEVLPVLEEELPRRERPLLLADVVAAQDAAGNARAARANQERLAGGTLGRRAAREARLALAARDAAEGKLGDLAGRFADMPMEDAVQTRARADAIAVGELLRGGNEIAALGMMTERKVEARSLAPADQLLLARALRKVGLLDQSRRVLAAIGAASTGPLPDGYYEERGALALAHDDAPGALEVADEWRAARGGNQPPGAIALKARARAAKGDARGATEALEKELAPLDPMLARDVAIDLAGELRSADPALARHLAQGALVEGALPPLEPAREAEALSALADAAEATGDRAAAQAAFTRLASELSAQPAAAGAAYRAARLAAAAPAAPVAGAAAAPAQQTAAKAAAAAPIVDDDPLSRRIAAAGQLYQEVVAGMQGAKP